MTLQLWGNFEKKNNSTLQPSGSASIVLEVTLKKDTSILEPTFIIQGQPETVLSPLNYCAWNSRFYFIDNVIFRTNTQAELVCKVDALATYRGDILGQTFFVERSASSFYQMLPDSYVARLNTFQSRGAVSSALPDPWGLSYAVRVVGSGTSSSAAGIKTYIMSASTLANLLNYIFSSGNFEFLVEDAIKSFFNPFQYIVSVMAFPYKESAFYLSGELMERVKLGWWEIPIQAHVVTLDVVGYTLTIAGKELPYMDFRAISPQWTTYKLFLPGAGLFFLSSFEVQPNVDIKINYSVDTATGEAFIRVYQEGFASTIMYASGRMGTSVSIGQLESNLDKTVETAAHGIGSLLNGRIGDALSDIISGAQEALVPSANVNGSAGNLSAIRSNPVARLNYYQHQSGDIPVTTLGRPLMKNVLLSTLSGYCKCAGARINLKGTEEERKMIDNFLNGGFYIE